MPNNTEEKGVITLEVIIIGLALLLVLSIILAITFGPVSIDYKDVAKILYYRTIIWL